MAVGGSSSSWAGGGPVEERLTTLIARIGARLLQRLSVFEEGTIMDASIFADAKVSSAGVSNCSYGRGEMPRTGLDLAGRSRFGK